MLLYPITDAPFFWTIFGVLAGLALAVIWLRSHFGRVAVLVPIAAMWLLLSAVGVLVLSNEGFSIDALAVSGGTSGALLIPALFPAWLLPASIDARVRASLALAAPLLVTIFSLYLWILGCSLVVGGPIGCNV